MITKIQNDIKDSMRSKDSFRLNVLRALKNEITNAALRKGNVDSVVSDIEIVGLVRKEISKRQDSLVSFKEAKRWELVDKENGEIMVLQEYLPIEMSAERLREMVETTITELGATSKKDMGKVIKAVVEKADGRADNKSISKLVGELLQ